jgi:hypothetical protein
MMIGVRGNAAIFPHFHKAANFSGNSIKLKRSEHCCSEKRRSSNDSRQEKQISLTKFCIRHTLRICPDGENSAALVLGCFDFAGDSAKISISGSGKVGNSRSQAAPFHSSSAVDYSQVTRALSSLLVEMTSVQLVLSTQQCVRSLSNIKFKSKQFKYTPDIIWNKCLLQCVKGVLNKIHSQIAIVERQLSCIFLLKTPNRERSRVWKI